MRYFLVLCCFSGFFVSLCFCLLHYYFDDFVRSGGSHHRLAVRIVWHDSLSISMNVAAYTVKKGGDRKRGSFVSDLDSTGTGLWLGLITHFFMSHTLSLSLSLSFNRSLSVLCNAHYELHGLVGLRSVSFGFSFTIAQLHLHFHFLAIMQ